jgi:ribosomal protein S1
LLPHLLDSTKVAKVASLFLNDEENLKIGQIIEDAQVTTHTYKGIYVKFKGENSKLISGFIPKVLIYFLSFFFKNFQSIKYFKRHLFDANDNVEEEEDETNKSDNSNLKKSKNDPKNMNKEELERLFLINTNIKARIYDFSLIEDIILLSVRPSVLEAPYMTYSELHVGQIVKCTVRSINPINGGVNVKLSEFVSGFIPKIHTSDVPLSDALLPRKMKAGTELKCKILQLDSDGKRCVLTAKKSLIKSKLETIESFFDLKMGLETYGIVVSIQKYGLLLSFFNDLKGLIPRNQLSTSLEVLSLDKDLKEVYYVGQVIKCKVFEFNREKQLLKLSLIMADDFKPNMAKIKNSEKTLQNLEKPDYEIGDLIESATILQVNEENYYFRVKLSRGKVNGIIYKNHLSDFDCLNDILFECYKRTMKINNLMITRYSSDVSKNQIENNKVCHYLTLKTSLIDEYTEKSKNEIAKTFSDLKVNDLYHGWIRKILNNGVLVEMPFNLIGFSSNQDISYINELKSTPNSLSVGQSVLIKIAKLYEEKKQFITSIRTRHNLHQKNLNETNFMIELFKSFIVNTKNIFNLLANNRPSESNSLIHPNSIANKQIWENAANKIRIGSIVKVAVKSFNKTTKQIECLFLNDLNQSNESNLVGIAFSSSNDNLEQGTKLDALILAFDPLAKVFCLSIENRKIKTYKKNFDPNFRCQVFCKQGQAIKSEIIYISEWFCIVGLKAHALGRLAFMPLFKNDFTQLNTFSAEPSIKPNSSIETKIKRQQLLQVSSASFSSLSKSENASESSSLSFADIKFSKEDKNFAYYCIGQTGKVIVKLNGSNEVENLDYLIVTHDSTEIKKNKKLLLRQLAILNENHQSVESNDSNKKVNENNDPIIIRKKLVLENNKRKLSNISNQEENNKDFIEIVSDIKSKKPKLENTETNDSFPWEVTSFDVFNRVMNSLNGNSDEQTNLNDNSEKNKKVKNFIDDQKLHEVTKIEFISSI